MFSTTTARAIRAVSLLLICTLLVLPSPADAGSFDVNSIDDNDDGQCDYTHCSLREAINAANNNPGADTIGFSGLDALGGNVTIQLLSPLPPLLDDETTIDGTTIQGYINTPLINIVKASGVIEDGIAIQSNNNIIQGLSLAGFGSWPNQADATPDETYGGAIVVTGSGNLIHGNILGWGAWPNTVGVRLAGGGNSIVGNVISGNGTGVYLQGPGQILQGNKIGTDADGNTAIPNAYGVYDASNSGGSHIIGGSGAGEGNIISGNQFNGVYLQSANNMVLGNSVGTNASGTAALPNNLNGIYIYGAFNNIIGGSSPGEGNLISGNGRGIYISASPSSGAFILGNTIGSDANGTTAIPNHVGIGVMSSSGVTIGGLNTGEGNLIFGNDTGFRLENEVDDHDISVVGNIITQNGVGILRIEPYPGAAGFKFSQNSIFGNSGLGIMIYAWESTVPSLAPPQLNSASNTSVSGTACPYCQVEIFSADPDPSGAGEGKTYLATASADANGLFTAAFSPVGVCHTLTATSTNSQNNTSEFSQNITGNCILLEPPLLYPLWIFIITVFGAIGILLRRRNPAGPRYVLPGSLAAGVLVGAGLLFLGNALPNVIVDFSPEQPVLYHGQLPGCASYLDPSGFSPQDGASLESPQDIRLEWDPAGDLPEGMIRWTVELTQNALNTGIQAAEENTLSISTFGMTPTVGDSFEWFLSGERLLTDGETWLPFCSPDSYRTFSIARPLAGEPAPEDTGDGDAEQPEPTACTPLVTALVNLTCRFGPGSIYEEEGYLLLGESAAILGQNTDGSWWQIPNPDWQGTCWVWEGGVEATCLPEQIVIVPAPPLPTALPQTCVSTLDRSACNEAGGMWAVDTSSCQCP